MYQAVHLLGRSWNASTLCRARRKRLSALAARADTDADGKRAARAESFVPRRDNFRDYLREIGLDTSSFVDHSLSTAR
jgi:hypothetical protein